VLNDLRRRAIEQLAALREDPGRRQTIDPEALDHLRAEIPSAPCEPISPRLHVLARTMEQLRAVLETRVRSVYCEFEDIRQYKQAVSLARGAGVAVGLATVRGVKPGEEGLLRQVAAREPERVRVRNTAGPHYARPHAP